MSKLPEHVVSETMDTELSDLQTATEHVDPVVEYFKKDVDRTLLRENLKLTVEQRIRKAQRFHASIDRWRGAANRG
jgi:hypothetical protein